MAHDAPEFSEADIEDAMAFQQEQSQSQVEDEAMFDGDAMDQDELEAMLAYEEKQPTTPHQPSSPSSMLDDDYDEIFAELIAQEQSFQQRCQPHPTNEIEMMDGIDEMSQ